MKIRLTADERDVINCLDENSIRRARIIKYALAQGVDLNHISFDYNSGTGEITYPSELLKINSI